MAYTPKTISCGFLTTSAASVLTGETGKIKRVTSISFRNKHSALVDVAIWFAPNDATNVRTVATDDQYEQTSISLSAGDSTGILCGFTLGNNNDTIQMKASVASVVSVTIDYIEEA